MAEQRLHDGRFSAADFERLDQAISDALISEQKRLQALEPGQKRDLDRDLIKAAFDNAGFKDCYFNLNFEAPLEEFYAELKWIHQEEIFAHKMIRQTYPTGTIDLDDLEPA